MLDSYFHQRRYEQADATFMTLFAWQKPYQIQWAEENNILYIRSGRGNKQFWIPPFTRRDSDFSKGMERMQKWFKEHDYPFLLKGVTPKTAQRIRECCPDCYVFTPDRDNYEYVYLTQNLINLSGKKYRQKKNNLNHFRNEYIGKWEYVSITDELFEECLAAEMNWYKQHKDKEDAEDLAGERQAIEMVFKHWNELGVTGGAIRIFNRIVAFSIGEMMNEDTAIIHFEKSDPTIRGLYQAINHEFVVHAWSHTTYINREEDMGIPGLRHSKESYNPCHFVEKFDVTLRNT
ncbi:DUF2156 domain-containing protein [Megasphaera hutchinsoni]